VHVFVLAIALFAVSVATYQATSSSAENPTTVPSFAYSGVAGSVRVSAGETYLRPGTSLRTLDSVAISTRQSNLQSLRPTGGVAPSSSLSAGVSAAASTNGEQVGENGGLADLIDPRTPFAVWVTRPGDSLGTIADRFGVSIETILDNNPTVTDQNIVSTGLELIVPRADGILHKVALGETLAEIVNQYDNITMETTRNFRPNNIGPDDEIDSGGYVLLPGARIKPPPTPTPTPPPTATPVPAAPPSAGSGSGSSGSGTSGGGGGGGVGPPARSGGRFSSPLAAYNRVTDEFGTVRALRGGRMHTGIDLGLWGYSGSTIYASCDGVVNRTEWLTYGYGYYVTIDCGDGWSTLYAHMGRIDVALGQRVTQGTPLGISGLTGFTTGEHLHYEIRYYGAPVNPRNHINF
jgi:murein DD-endopeptidase MepM/ murein hydrolase activator NlpD